jgi:hypothetical protein
MILWYIPHIIYLLFYINSKIKNSFNFTIFYYHTNKLYEKYNDLIKLFIKNNLLEEDEYNELKIKNIFLKNLFSNWYVIYKKNVDNGVNKFRDAKKILLNYDTNKFEYKTEIKVDTNKEDWVRKTQRIRFNSKSKKRSIAKTYSSKNTNNKSILY